MTSTECYDTVKENNRRDMNINFESFTGNEFDINALGEFLRACFFNQNKGLGCSESFELNKDVIQLPDETDYEYENELNSDVYTVASWNGITMKYLWDGDGYLHFELPSGLIIYNDDCKKDGNWKKSDSERKIQ